MPPPPPEQGRPRRGGDERPARCASAGRAKNNCGVLATAFPLAGRARRRLRIGVLPQPVSRRGCAWRAVPGAAWGLSGDVVTRAAATYSVPGAPAPHRGAFAGSDRVRGYRLPWRRTTIVMAIPGARGRWRHLHRQRLSCTAHWQAEGTLTQRTHGSTPFISKHTHY